MIDNTQWLALRNQLREAGAESVLKVIGAEASRCYRCEKIPTVMRRAWLYCGCGAFDVADYIARAVMARHGAGAVAELIAVARNLLRSISR